MAIRSVVWCCLKRIGQVIVWHEQCLATEDSIGQYRRLNDNAKQLQNRARLNKARQKNTAQNRAMEGMVENCMAMQGRVNTERFRQVMALQGRRRTDSARQI